MNRIGWVLVIGYIVFAFSPVALFLLVFGFPH